MDLFGLLTKGNKTRATKASSPGFSLHTDGCFCPLLDEQHLGRVAHTPRLLAAACADLLFRVRRGDRECMGTAEWPTESRLTGIDEASSQQAADRTNTNRRRSCVGGGKEWRREELQRTVPPRLRPAISRHLQASPGRTKLSMLDTSCGCPGVAFPFRFWRRHACQRVGSNRGRASQAMQPGRDSALRNGRQANNCICLVFVLVTHSFCVSLCVGWSGIWMGHPCSATPASPPSLLPDHSSGTKQEATQAPGNPNSAENKIRQQEPRFCGCLGTPHFFWQFWGGNRAANRKPSQGETANGGSEPENLEAGHSCPVSFCPRQRL